MLELMESAIWDAVSGVREEPGNAHERIKLAKDKAKGAYIREFQTTFVQNTRQLDVDSSEFR